MKEQKTTKNQTIIIHVVNKPGVISRIAALFTRRGYNLESLAVGTTPEHEACCITVVVQATDKEIVQIGKQLVKLVDVIEAYNLTAYHMIQREIVLIKVEADSKTCNEIREIVNAYNAKVVVVGEAYLIVEVSGAIENTEELIKKMSKYGILELSRSGMVAISQDKIERQ